MRTIAVCCALSLGACGDSSEPGGATEGVTVGNTISGSGPDPTVPTTGGLGEQCGLVCDEQAFANGKFNVSGVASIDAFFAAALDVSAEMDATAKDVALARAGLLRLVDALGTADFQASFDARMAPYLAGQLRVRAGRPLCVVPAEVTAAAAAACDAAAMPGNVEVQCEGACRIPVTEQVACRDLGGLTCQGMAPNLACEGTCHGACELQIAAACDGVCRGDCNGVPFEGYCPGMCQGTCENDAGGPCQGICLGVCEFEPFDACDSPWLVSRCSVPGQAGVSCHGPCEGLTTASVAAECEATVEAQTATGVQCYPPALMFEYELAVLGDPMLRAEFRAFAHEVRRRYGALRAAVARAEPLLDASAKLATAGATSIEAHAFLLAGQDELDVRLGADCAITTLPQAQARIGAATQSLAVEVAEANEVIAAITAE